MNILSLTVIMPALNEANNIQEAIETTLFAFEKLKINGEIMVINDGSTDKTGELVEKFANENPLVKVIHHEKPLGIGYSFWEAVRHSDKDIVVMFPGDNENDPEDALTYFYLMNYVDIIVPFIQNTEIRNRFRRAISVLYSFIINMSFMINLNYTNGTVFYRRCILNSIELRSFGFFYQAELLIKLIRKGYLFAEVPNFLNKRNNGNSKALSFKSFFKVMSGYLNLAYDIHIKSIESRRKDYKKLCRESITYIRRNSFEERTKEPANV
ncbi:MAG: glycosyltransferase family 2 protein [Candidatus Gastranaerophilales bacterium]|nr:glycosyltransferase family 2 protein [Candidatus Gastranaerophilales bacterium]